MFVKKAQFALEQATDAPEAMSRAGMLDHLHFNACSVQASDQLPGLIHHDQPVFLAVLDQKRWRSGANVGGW